MRRSEEKNRRGWQGLLPTVNFFALVRRKQDDHYRETNTMIFPNGLSLGNVIFGLGCFSFLSSSVCVVGFCRTVWLVLGEHSRFYSVIQSAGCRVGLIPVGSTYVLGY